MPYKALSTRYRIGTGTRHGGVTCGVLDGKLTSAADVGTQRRERVSTRSTEGTRRDDNDPILNITYMRQETVECGTRGNVT